MIATVLITGICIYVAVKHGMRATKFLARLSAFKFKRKIEKGFVDRYLEKQGGPW